VVVTQPSLIAVDREPWQLGYHNARFHGLSGRSRLYSDILFPFPISLGSRFMSQDSPNDAGVDTPPIALSSQKSDSEHPNHVVLVTYPNIVFLYPTVLTALFCAVFMWARGMPGDQTATAASYKNSVVEFSGVSSSIMKAGVFIQAEDETAAKEGTDASTVPVESELVAAAPAVEGPTYHYVCARIFLAVFALNMVVIAFDFPRTTSLTWFFALATTAIAGWFLMSSYPELAPKILQGLLTIKPAANASFYMIYTAIMLFLYMCILISRRFDYWEVKGNELLHHHGFLSNLERFSAPNLRISKEINDLFEYLLLRSGRLIIHASNERRAIVLDNILMINSKEERITKMLGALQVRVRTDK